MLRPTLSTKLISKTEFHDFKIATIVVNCTKYPKNNPGDDMRMKNIVSSTIVLFVELSLFFTSIKSTSWGAQIQHTAITTAKIMKIKISPVLNLFASCWLFLVWELEALAALFKSSFSGELPAANRVGSGCLFSASLVRLLSLGTDRQKKSGGNTVSWMES